jgi:hypothetical protein
MTVGRSLSSSSIVVVEEEEEVCGGGAEEGLLLEEEQHCEHDGSVYNSAAVDFIIYMDEEEYNKKGSAESGIQPQVREVRIQPIQEEEEQQQKVGSSHQHQIIRKPTCSSSSSCALRRPPLSRNGPAVSRRSPYRSARRSFDFGATSNKEQQQQSPKVHGKFVTCSSSYLKGPPSSIDYGSVSNGEI